MSPVLPEKSQTQSSSGDYFPISEISSYQTKWVICARVTDKAPLRTFNRKVGGAPGNVFSVTLLDAAGGEIRASFFNECVDRFHDMIEVGKCYKFSKGSVRVANRQYNPTNHRYEIAFDRFDATCEPTDENKSIQAVKFSFVDMTEVQKRQPPFIVDLIGVVTSFDQPMPLVAKDGRQLVKREIVIADDTATSIGITLWGERATLPDSQFQGNPVLALKGIQVREFNGGRNGSILQSSHLVFDPENDICKRLKSWWSGGGKTQSLSSLSSQGLAGNAGSRGLKGTPVDFQTLRKEIESFSSEKPQLFTVPACRLNLVQLRKQGDMQPLSYMACAESKENGLPCNRRVNEDNFCMHCNKVIEAVPRLNLRCLFSDDTGGCWLTTFHEGAQQAIGMKAAQLNAMEKSDREGLENLILSKYFMYPLTITARAKLDSYQGEPRTNSTCVDVRPVNIRDYGRQLAKEIKEMCMAA